MKRYSLAVLIASLSVLLVIAGFCGYKVHRLSARQETIKGDYSTVNNITFGLLSVSEWRDKIVAVVNKRIRDFRLTRAQEKDIHHEISRALHSLIDTTVDMIERPQRTIGGKLRKLAFNTLVNRKDLDKLVPVFSKKIMEEIKKPETRRKLSHLAESKLEEWEQGTYDRSLEAEKRAMDSLLDKYHVRDVQEFNEVTAKALSAIRETTYHYAFGLLGCILVMLSLWWFLRKRPELHTALYIMSILSAVILLLVGLTTTMIEIDARIQSLDFRLMGETISFKNQVLFFQSKSIVDVVGLLIRTGKYDAIIVGVLILCFSIVFPVTKLLSAGIYILSRRGWTKNRVIEYFAFKSGKWSMADVMVVAILMTYIGFNGILDSELSGLNIHNDTLTSITTNQTSLQPGYIVFTGFVLYGLVLAQILKNLTHPHDGKLAEINVR